MSTNATQFAGPGAFPDTLDEHPSFINRDPHPGEKNNNNFFSSLPNAASCRPVSSTIIST